MSAERRVELTTSGWIGDPDNCAQITGTLNKERSEERQLRLELYSVAHRLPISERTASKIPILREHLYAFRDGIINLERIEGWQRDFGPVPIERIHLPFHYSSRTGLKNFFWNSMFRIAKPYEPGKAKDRWLIAVPIAYMTRSAMNMFATRLVKEIGDNLGQDYPGYNAHVNIVERAERDGTLSMIRGKARYIYVENDLDYPRVRPEQVKAERDPKRAIAAVERNHLEGIILGIDHAYRAELDPRRDFEQMGDYINKHLKVLHLSGSREDHGLITDDDEEFWSFMDFVKGEVSPDVSFCLDLNPQQMGRLSLRQQFEYVRDLVEKLEKY